MNEELKRRAEEWLADCDGPVTDLLRDLLAECQRAETMLAVALNVSGLQSNSLNVVCAKRAECERLDAEHTMMVEGFANAEARIAELERRAEQPKKIKWPEAKLIRKCDSIEVQLQAAAYNRALADCRNAMATDSLDRLIASGLRHSADVLHPEQPKPDPGAVGEIREDEKGGGYMHWYADMPALIHGTKLYATPPAIPEIDSPDVEAVRSGRAVAISPRALEALRKRAIPSGYALTISRAETATSENSEWLWLQSPRGDVVRVGENGRNGVGPVIYNFLHAFAAKVQP